MMPRVSVVLKTGTEIEVEGANDATWEHRKLTDQTSSEVLFLVVYYKEPNKTEIRGRFRGEDVAGYTIDPR